MKLFRRDKFTCQKCSFRDKSCKEIEPCLKSCDDDEIIDSLENVVTLCNICHNYAPKSKEGLEKYISEKIDSKILETFRNTDKSISKTTKEGMNSMFKAGNLVTRAPFGYKATNKKLQPSENSHFVGEIFQTFVDTPTSLTKLSKRYGMSVNGLKKILSNEVYLGKIKFNSQIIQGKHATLVSQELFNKAQEKLKNLKRN